MSLSYSSSSINQVTPMQSHKRTRLDFEEGEEAPTVQFGRRRQVVQLTGDVTRRASNSKYVARSKGRTIQQTVAKLERLLCPILKLKTQSVQQISTLGNKQAWASFNVLNGADIFRMRDKARDINPMAALGNTLPSAKGMANGEFLNIDYLGGHVKHIFTNTSNHLAYLTLIEYAPKGTQTRSPDAVWLSDLNRQEPAFNAVAPIDKYSAAGTALQFNRLLDRQYENGWRPTDRTMYEFKYNYATLGETKVELRPGETFEFTQYIPAFYVDWAQYASIQSGVVLNSSGTFSKWSRFLYAFLEGEYVTGAVSATDGNGVFHGSAQLEWGAERIDSVRCDAYTSLGHTVSSGTMLDLSGTANSAVPNRAVPDNAQSGINAQSDAQETYLTV